MLVCLKDDLKFKKIISAEKVIDIPYEISSNVIWGKPEERLFARLFRWATLNGHIYQKYSLKKVWCGNLKDLAVI